MKRIFCLILLGLLGAGGAGTMIGCEASAKVDPDTDGHAVTKTEVKHEYPTGDTSYQRTTETKTEVH